MMDLIGEVMTSLQEDQNSKSSRYNKLKPVMLVSEVKESKIPCELDFPVNTQCIYCKKELEAKALVLTIGNPKVIGFAEYQECTCKESIKAKEYYKKILDEQEKRKKAEEEQQKYLKLVKSSKIKKRFWSRTFNNFEITEDNKKSFMICKKYTERFNEFLESGKGLYIFGSYGVGKTHLAAAIANDLLKKGITTVMATGIDILAEVRATFNSNSDKNEEQVLSVYKNCELLIIDDLGKESKSEWSATTLYDIINYRYEQMKPIIITSNYSDAAIRQNYGESCKDIINATMSRLIEMTYRVTVAGNDWRENII